MRLVEDTEHLGSGASEESGSRLAMVRHVLRALLPSEIVVTLPSLGELILRPWVLDGGVTWLSGVQGSSCESTWIECGGTKVTLAVERGFASHIVNTLVGCESALASGPFARIERGLLQGALVALAAQLQLPPDVRLSVDAFEPAVGALAFEVSLVLGEVSGRAWMSVSPEFLSRYLDFDLASSSENSRAIRIELGRTHVRCSDSNAVEEGDLVVFDELRALSADEAWPVHLHRDNSGVRGSLCPDGSLVLLQAGTGENKSDAGTLRQGQSASAEVWPGGENGRPDDEIAADLGCLQPAAFAAYLRGIPLRVERNHQILLRRNGVAWAEGDLIAFEKAMAVRITRLAAG